MNLSHIDIEARQFQTLPGVGFGTALLLAAAFESPAHLMASVPATIMRKCNLDESKARAIKMFFTKRNSESV